MANIKRDLETCHSRFNDSFPAIADLKTKDCEFYCCLQSFCYFRPQDNISTRKRKKGISAWNLAKAIKPFTDVELIKTCVTDLVM